MACESAFYPEIEIDDPMSASMCAAPERDPDKPIRLTAMTKAAG
jgi:hypothetical protein